MVLSKHAKNVPTGEIAIKTVTVFGESKITAPQTRPKKAPTYGPSKTAPKVIGTRAKFKLTPVGII